MTHLTAPESGCVQDFNRYYNYGLIPSLPCRMQDITEPVPAQKIHRFCVSKLTSHIS